jgi:hypothetical protein
MQIQKLPNAAASKIAVTNASALLTALIATAASAVYAVTGQVNGVDLFVEDGDVRMLMDGNTPTATSGVLLRMGSYYQFRGVPIEKMRLISTSASSVAISLQVGKCEAGEVSQMSLVPRDVQGDVLNDKITERDEAGSSTGVISASVLARTGTTQLQKLIVYSATAGTVKIWDNTAGSGTILEDTMTFTTSTPIVVDLEHDVAGTGVYITIGGTISCKLIFFDPTVK